MESRIQNAPPTDESHATEKLLNELKGMIQRLEQRALERAKAADRVVRDHPYPTIGLALGLGLLVGFLIRRK
ncbi:MAG TPA: hypothetical protein VFE51_09585 [Verrucomicrobiae bacterium]|nr:hypothetical protein [Verrucomicrobiae bacterium]